MGREKRKGNVAQEGLSKGVQIELNSERWGKGSIPRSEERVIKAGGRTETKAM